MANADNIVTGTSAIATVDPYFFIDPSFPNAELYQVITSLGVGNLPNNVSVPGPTPGAGLLSLGFLILAGSIAKARATYRAGRAQNG